MMEAKPDTINRKRERERKRKYRQSVREVSLSFPKATSTRLEEMARQHGLTLPKFIKACAVQKLDGTGYVVPNQNAVRQLTFQISKIGNNINQITRYIHVSKNVEYPDIERLQALIRNMEDQVQTAMTRPPQISDVIRHYLSQHPAHANRLIHFINHTFHDC